MSRITAIPLVVLVLAAGLLAGCGQDAKEPAAGHTAALAPRGSLVYAEADLRPKGSQAKALAALADRFPGTGGPGARVKKLLDDAARESGGRISFSRDIEPWLGDHAGAFAAGLGSTGQPSAAAAVIDTTDGDASMAAVEKGERGAGRTRKYRGKELKVWRARMAAAVVGHELVVGNVKGVKAAMDADAGDGLDSSPEYAKAVAKLPGSRLGLTYFNGKALATSPAFRNPALTSLRKLSSVAYAASFAAEDDAVVVDATLPKDAAKSLPGASVLTAGAGDLVGDLPAGAWLASGQPDFGKALDSYVDSIATSLGGRENLDRAVRSATGLDLQRDLLSWVGDMSVYAKGSSVSSLDAAVVLQTDDPAASKRALKALRALIVKQSAGEASVGKLTAPGGGTGFTVRAGNGLPKPVHVVQRGGRVVIAYGDRAVSAVFASGDRLADSQEFKDAAGSLGAGYELSSFVDPGPLLQLAESSDGAANPDYVKAKPYLDALGPLVAGVKGDGDRIRSRLRLGVK